MPNPKKTAIVAKLTTILQESPHLVLIQFHKTKHIALEKLRKELKKNNANLLVVKNTLFNKAISRLADKNQLLEKLRRSAQSLPGESALISLKDDWTSGLKAFFNFSKTDVSLFFKVGLIENNLYDKAALTRLAQLPGRKELLATIIASFKAPITRTARAFKFPVQKFVYILSQKSQQS